jgi:hypothetical protein
MFDHNMVREVVYGIAIIIALGGGPWTSPFTGWHYTRWALCVVIIIMLFMMLVR